MQPKKYMVTILWSTDFANPRPPTLSLHLISPVSLDNFHVAPAAHLSSRQLCRLGRVVQGWLGVAAAIQKLLPVGPPRLTVCVSVFAIVFVSEFEFVFYWVLLSCNSPSPKAMWALPDWQTKFHLYLCFKHIWICTYLYCFPVNWISKTKNWLHTM